MYQSGLGAGAATASTASKGVLGDSWRARFGSTQLHPVTRSAPADQLRARLIGDPSPPSTTGVDGAADGIHVWTIHINSADEEPLDVDDLLSTDELERALRIRNPLHRHAFVQGRGALRAILSTYLGVDPRELRFGHRPCPVCGGGHGKPFVPDDVDLQFSFSSSYGCALVAVSRRREVGVDVEYIDPERGAALFPWSALSPQEFADLVPRGPRERQEMFLRYWTRKEAFTKGMGVGLAVPFATIDAREQGLRLLRSDGRVDQRWTVLDLDSPSGYVAALAVGNGGKREVCMGESAKGG